MKYKKLIYGVGNTDINASENGKRKRSYETWCNMLKRCYYHPTLNKQPTYQVCTVHSDWHIYSNFDTWFQKNYIQGFDLDKDLLVYGNKEYGPNTCRFVPRNINGLFLDCGSRKGQYMIGVSFCKKRNKYQSQCSDGIKKQNIGRFDTELEAHNAWRSFKLSVIKKVADEALQLGLIQQDLYESIINRPI